MRVERSVFLKELLDLAIVECEAAAAAIENGEEEKACDLFVDYLKKSLKPELKFQIKESIAEMPGDIEESVYADMILEGHVFSVGYPYFFEGGKILWNYNPMPNQYCEWVYHLQYHSEMVVLARAYLRTGDEKYAKRFQEMILSWIDQVERPDDVKRGWLPTYRNLEMGGRLGNSWPFCIHAFLKSKSVTNETWMRIFQAVWEQTDWLSQKFTNRNWIIHELYGVLSTGVYFPFFKKADHWIAVSLSRLIEELHIQVYPDGIATDRSFTYQRSNLHYYVKIIQLLNTYGIPVPEKLKEGLYRQFCMYCFLSKPDLMMPRPNDCGKCDAQEIAKLGLLLYPEDELLQFTASRGMEGNGPQGVVKLLPYGGFGVLRSDWTDQAVWLFMDGGAPDYNSGWHVHESCLNIELYAYGTDMLKDQGKYHYDTSPMRKYSCSTRSHNTGLVDGMGQLSFVKSDRLGDIDTTKIGRMTFEEKENYASIQGYYDYGYGNYDRVDQQENRSESHDVMAKHIRKVIFFHKGLSGSRPFYLMIDHFETMDDKEHLYEISFQLDDVNVTRRETGVTIQYENHAVLCIESITTPEVIKGQTQPVMMGWKQEMDYAKEHTPAPLVSFAQKGRNVSFATLLYPSPDEKIPDLRVVMKEEESHVIIYLNMVEHTIKYE